MRHTYRFIGSKNSDGQWEISKDEYLHLSKVLRLKTGDEVELANGSGLVANATIRNQTKSKCEFDVLSESFFEIPKKQYEIFIGALKTSSLEDLIAPLVELGVASINFFGQPGSEKSRLSEKVKARCDKIVLSAVKQSKNPYLPNVVFSKSLEMALDASDHSLSQNIILYPGAEIKLAEQLEGTSSDLVRIFVGGEKGWHDSELESLSRIGVIKVSLGDSILRAWTAAVTAAALCNQLL